MSKGGRKPETPFIVCNITPKISVRLTGCKVFINHNNEECACARVQIKIGDLGHKYHSSCGSIFNAKPSDDSAKISVDFIRQETFLKHLERFINAHFIVPSIDTTKNPFITQLIMRMFRMCVFENISEFDIMDMDGCVVTNSDFTYKRV